MKFNLSDFEIIDDSRQGDYLKFSRAGEYKLRILSPFVSGWEDWVEINGGPKPVRYRKEDKPAKSHDPLKPMKSFCAMIVWNYAEGRPQVLSVTQRSIQKALKDLIYDEDYGDPREYDIKITREDGTPVKYLVKPLPPKPLGPDIKAAVGKLVYNLDALFDNGHPLENTPSREPVAVAAKLPSEQGSPWMEILKERVELEGIDSLYLEDYIAYIAGRKNNSLQETAERALLVFDKFKETYLSWTCQRQAS